MTDRCKVYCKKNGWDCAAHRRFYKKEREEQLAEEAERERGRQMSDQKTKKLRRFLICLLLSAIWIHALMRVPQSMQIEE